jgi:hypothetical protein
MEDMGSRLFSGFWRVQEGARISKHSVRKSRRDENSNLKYNGNTVRKKDELHLVDCNVAGSDSGTSDAPKYALLDLFRDIISPEIHRLVRPGGKYEGYIPLMQGDNDGPHEEATYDGLLVTARSKGGTGSHRRRRCPT